MRERTNQVDIQRDVKVTMPDGAVLLAASGSPRLATAGSGDVLSGVIGAFVARGVGCALAGAIAAHVHGVAACSGRAEGLVAEDLPELVSDVLSRAVLVQAGLVGASDVGARWEEASRG